VLTDFEMVEIDGRNRKREREKKNGGCGERRERDVK